MSKELIIIAIGLAFMIFPCGLAYHFCHLEIFCDDKAKADKYHLMQSLLYSVAAFSGTFSIICLTCFL